jgi:beta-fructofuranosidase
MLVNAKVDVLDGAYTSEFKPGTALDIVFTTSKSGEALYCLLAFYVSALVPSFYCDRGRALGGWGGWPADKMRMMGLQEVPTYDSDARSWNITMIIDHSVLEVYLNGGLAAGTLIFFPKEKLNGITLRTRGIKDMVKASVIVQRLIVG